MELAKELDLPRIKVYKWNWDHKRKFYIDSIKSGETNLPSDFDDIEVKSTLSDRKTRHNEVD